MVNFNCTSFALSHVESPWVLACRGICAIPAIECAIRAIGGLGEVTHFYLSSTEKLQMQSQNLSIPEIKLQKEKLKAACWKKLKAISQNALGALFLGVCSLHPHSKVAGAGASTFLIYSKFRWKKFDANVSTYVTGIFVSILYYKVKFILKMIAKGVKFAILKILSCIRKVASKILSCIKSIGKAIVKHPLTFAKHCVKAIINIASVIFSGMIKVAKPLLKISFSVIKLCLQGTFVIIKNPPLMVGIVALGIIFKIKASLNRFL